MEHEVTVIYRLKKDHRKRIRDIKEYIQKECADLDLTISNNQIAIRGNLVDLFRVLPDVQRYLDNRNVNYEVQIKDDLPRKYEELCEEIERIRQENGILEGEVKKYKKKIGTLQRKVSDLTSRLEEHKKQLEKYKNLEEKLRGKFKEEAREKVIDYLLRPDYEKYVKVVKAYNRKNIDAIKNYIDACLDGVAEDVLRVDKLPEEAYKKWEETEYYRKNHKRYELAEKIISHVKECKESGIEVPEDIFAMKLDKAKRVITEFEYKRKEHERLQKLAKYHGKELAPPKVVIEGEPTREKVEEAFRDQVGLEPQEDILFDLIILSKETGSYSVKHYEKVSLAMLP